MVTDQGATDNSQDTLEVPDYIISENHNDNCEERDTNDVAINCSTHKVLLTST